MKRAVISLVGLVAAIVTGACGDKGITAPTAPQVQPTIQNTTPANKSVPQDDSIFWGT